MLPCPSSKVAVLFVTMSHRALRNHVSRFFYESLLVYDYLRRLKIVGFSYFNHIVLIL